MKKFFLLFFLLFFCDFCFAFIRCKSYKDLSKVKKIKVLSFSVPTNISSRFGVFISDLFKREISFYTNIKIISENKETPDAFLYGRLISFLTSGALGYSYVEMEVEIKDKGGNILWRGWGRDYNFPKRRIEDSPLMEGVKILSTLLVGRPGFDSVKLSKPAKSAYFLLEKMVRDFVKSLFNSKR